MGQSFTPDGNLLGEAISALQKSIRRGESEDAAYFGLQVFSRFPYYLLKRLAVIVVEDIGLANLMLVERVVATSNTMLKSVEYHRGLKMYRPYGMIVAQLLREMSLSPKSREADHMVHEVLRERRVGQIKIPQQASYEDMVARLRGEIAARNEKEALNQLLTIIDGYATWIWPEMTVLAAETIGDGLVVSTMAHITATVLTFFDARKSYEGNFPAFAILLLCRSDESTRTAELFDAVTDVPKREIPDYAHDVHTGKGRRMGRDYMHFIKEGSLLVNEAYPSKYRFYDPVHGTASMAADGKTKQPEPYKVSNGFETGARRISEVPEKEPDDPRPEQDDLF